MENQDSNRQEENSSSIDTDLVCAKCGRDERWHEPVVSQSALAVYPPDHLFAKDNSPSETVAKLREMFPDKPDDYVGAWRSGLHGQPEAIVRVRGAHFFGDSFNECLTKVGDWKSAQDASGKDCNVSTERGSAATPLETGE